MELQLLPSRLTGRLPIVVTALTLAISSALGSPGLVAAADPAAEAAAHLSDEHGGAPADYQLVHERTATVPDSNESLWAAKLVDRSGEVFTVYRRSNGVLGDAAVLDTRTRSVAAALEPLAIKADAELQQRVASVQPSATVPVSVWFQADPASAVDAVIAAHPEVTWLDGRPTVTDLDQARALRAELYEAKSAAVATAAAELTKEVDRLGGSVAYVSPAAPIAFVDLPASATDALAVLPMVESLGLERTWTPTMTSAGPTVDANWTSGSGDQGAGVRVAVVEYHNVRNSGDLSGRVVASHSSTGTLAYTSGSTFDHPTWVAGAIAGHGSYPGVAPGARIVSAGTGGGGAGLARDRAVIATTDWAISPSGGDADIVSVSLIQDTTTGSEEARRYFDSVVDEDLRLVVAASGNFSAAATWRVGSPGTGWNVLTVGGNDDRNTVGRADDRIWYVPGGNGSSYIDPPGTSWNVHGDFNKPNLSAPAVSVRTANGLGASGTSVATPIVSGIAAQLLSRVPGLVAWPEGTRAVLMAGAIYHFRMPNGSYSADHEGTGSVSALWANRVLHAGDAPYGGYRLGSMSGTFSQAIHVQGKQRIRVVVSWNSRTGGSSNLSKSDTLASDLDLRLRLPNGSTVTSFSFDNNYEVIDVVSPVTGTATIDVIGSRVASGGERYGLAWAKIGGDATAPRVVSRAPESGEPWAAARTRLSVAFSEGVSGIGGSSVVLTPAGGGSQIPASLHYSASARRVTITPQSPLAPGSYRLGLTDQIRDLAGNRLAAQSWSFRVVASATPSSASLAPLERIKFDAGTYTGYQFDSAGRVTASRTGRLYNASGARADRRGTVAGQAGQWLHVYDGMWAGYWVRETSHVRIGGTIWEHALAATTRISFASGTHTGYRFAADGTVIASKTARLWHASGANTNQRAVINGAWHLHVTNGAWAGYWVRETSRSSVRGITQHHDMASTSVRFSSGTYTGLRFAADGSAVTSRTATLGAGSSAPAIAWAVINGTPRFLIGAGIWAGYWVAEGTRVRAP